MSVWNRKRDGSGVRPRLPSGVVLRRSQAVSDTWGQAAGLSESHSGQSSITPFLCVPPAVSIFWAMDFC